jgi:hypothetical protein
MSGQENNVSVSYSFVGNLIKSNEESLKEVDRVIESDPKTKQQFERDMKAMSEAKTQANELLAMLFENMQTQVKDDRGTKYMPIQSQQGVPYMYLRMAGRTEVPEMIKSLRRLQLTEFASPASYKRMGKEVGFSLKWKNPDFKPTDEQKKQLTVWEARFAERFFYPAGDRTPSLSKFLGACYEDFFDLDDITIQVLRDGTAQPIGMLLQDPSLWVPTIPTVKQYPRFDSDLFEMPESKEDFMTITEMAGAKIEEPYYAYLLMRGGKRYAAATEDVMLKSHFFARSEFRAFRRGYSIMEKAINVTSIILNAMTFNAANFSNNRVPAGVLALSGGYTNQLQIEKLKKLLWAQMSGVASQHKIPIIGLPEKADAKWVGIHSTPKELEFYTGTTLFMSIVYALSGTDPNESGLANFHDAMKGNKLNDDSKDGVWKKSKDNGLITFVSHIENTLNTLMSDGRNVFEQATKLPIKAVFEGLADEDLANKNTVNKGRLETATSINEIRAENGEEPQEYMVGDQNIYDIVGVSNQGILQLIRGDIQQKQQAEAAQQQQELMAQQQEAGAAGAGGQNAGEAPEEPSAADKELIDKYGQPETTTA